MQMQKTHPISPKAKQILEEYQSCPDAKLAKIAKDILKVQNFSENIERSFQTFKKKSGEVRADELYLKFIRMSPHFYYRIFHPKHFTKSKRDQLRQIEKIKESCKKIIHELSNPKGEMTKDLLDQLCLEQYSLYPKAVGISQSPSQYLINLLTVLSTLSTRESALNIKAGSISLAISGIARKNSSNGKLNQFCLALSAYMKALTGDYFDSVVADLVSLYHPDFDNAEVDAQRIKSLRHSVGLEKRNFVL